MNLRGVAARGLGGLVAVVALGATMTPAHGAPAVEWQDPAGDATALPGVESSPRPSDPELDLLGSSFAVRGSNVTVSTRVERMGPALGSGGSAFRFYFSYKERRYYVEAVMATLEYSLVFGADPGFYREGSGDAADEKLECFCRNKFDFKGHSVSFTLSKSDVARAIGAPVHGTELKDLEVRSLRTTYERFEADVARPSRGATLRL